MTEDHPADESNELPEDPAPAVARPVPIIGIGASAGGIDALRRLLPTLPADPPMGFVVVLHLDPDHPSILTEMLSRASAMPVREIVDGMKVTGGTVHVLPSGHTLSIDGGRLRLGPWPHTIGGRTTVDRFLMSLAEDQEENAACVILSGSGSDGTQGLRAIKDHGGLTIAQSEAEFDGMMRSAMTTGLVDYALPIEQISVRLAEYFRYVEDLATNGGDVVRQQAADYLTQIVGLLRVRTGHDFKDYKQKTVIRRVQRRMQMLQIAEAPVFIERLRRDPQEVDLLFQDLLIGVTGFFRDPEAFAALEREVIPRLFDGKGGGDTVRVWVPACATGEEAYSIAMLLRDHAPKGVGAPRLQIFASDIDQAALDVARAGRYPPQIASQISAARLEQYFVPEDGSYRVTGELREICLFSDHDLLRDAPFSRLDLIACRNLLIYLNADLQGRVIPLFHYALRDNGFLMLGTSENVSRHMRLFSVVDKVQRLFRRRAQPERRLPEFPLTTPEAPRGRGHWGGRPALLDRSLQALAERRILERYAPAHVVIDHDGEVRHASTRTGRYLELPPGVPDNNIFSLARSGLRQEIRGALQRAQATGTTVTRGRLMVSNGSVQHLIDLSVQPLQQAAMDETLFLIVFKDLGGDDALPETGVTRSAEETESVNVRQLEADLRTTRDRLQSATEELEASNEELKSSNEELTSMNEEMQSANEELETSREELQSINEELQTVNSELSIRVEELSRSNSDLANLLESTQIATLFLDAELRVKSFTPAARDVFRLVENDTGRPISHVRARFEPDTVQQDAERVLRTLNSCEREVRSTEENQSFIMRVLPYRTVDNVISGVVITFTDIARISAAEARISELAHDLRDRIESLETLLDLVPAGIFITQDPNGMQVHLNRRGAQLIGQKQDQRGLMLVADHLRLRVDDRELPPEQHPLRLAASSGEAVREFEARVPRPDGSEVDVIISATPLFGEDAQARGAIAAIVDISERKAAEAHQLVLLHELQHRVKNILATVSALATRMLRGAESLDDFSSGFLPRLRAMGHLHDLLSQRNWQPMALRDLLGASLAFYTDPASHSVTLDGPEVLLTPVHTSALAMVLHELATNAAKYGALSVPEGRLTITWRLGGAVDLEWLESHGPPVTAPVAEGFGIGFMRRSVEYELDGNFTQQFVADGILCRINFPLSRNRAEVPRVTASRA